MSKSTHKCKHLLLYGTTADRCKRHLKQTYIHLQVHQTAVAISELGVNHAKLVVTGKAGVGG